MLAEFCKLALSGIQTGAVTQKMYSKAAGAFCARCRQRQSFPLSCQPASLRHSVHSTQSATAPRYTESLQLDADAVRKAIEAIVAIFLECSKRFVA